MSAESVQALLECSVTELTGRFVTQAQPVPQGLLEALEADPRQGAQTLARKLRSRQEKNRAEGQRLRHLLKFETELWEQGLLKVAGVDEAGMAPLAGPVVAAAAILPRGYKLKGLDDSKKILDPDKREALAEALKRDVVAWAVGRAEVEEIDQLNIYHAGLLAMRRAVEGLGLTPDYVLVDARTIPQCPAPQRGIIKGDSLSLSIAAASVLAKTTRDRLMAQLDAQYPGYGLAAHKGYPTAQHVQAIQALGVLPIHRRSFGPVREALGLAQPSGPVPMQSELFAATPAPMAKR
ncbi:ribonuclease HII [Corallococcus exiguus]|uniref:Ribonuclease HII n=1 Tax=Corallococcus exiguus TaxID=83462 RepID=A0A7Y1RNL1_9BACT|nr:MULTISPECIES: ribonuclease HII [Corallococcus]RKI46097.1 ribonuclease HII [Corallococcus sp. AB004]NBC42840.1 ribonuclease HII [Corallococcus exiguus]NNB87594.1 ribonuclease HII [Corallococcus exiguus]NNB94676.1 ribonuclease HII [Corallococcus exiguus]NNC03007.1 ribonuclease HII [Corallococcus exiguus]